MKEKELDKETFKKVVSYYEQNVLGATFEAEIDSSLVLMKFKAQRRSKLVTFTTHKFPDIALNKILTRVVQELDAVPQYSEVVDFYCNTEVSVKKEEEMQSRALKEGITLKVYDVKKLCAEESLRVIFYPMPQEEKSSFFENVVCDYLSRSNDSSFIKNGFYYAQLLYIVYEKGHIYKKDLITELEKRLGTKIDSVSSDVDYLRRENRLQSKKQTGDAQLLRLTDTEIDRMKNALLESQELEKEFKHSFQVISSNYGISDYKKCIDAVSNFYLQRNFSLIGEDDESTSKNGQEGNLKGYEELSSTIKTIIPYKEKTQEYLAEIKELCKENGFLNRICAGKSFLNLYQSQRYQDYISGKVCRVILDTPLLIYLVCCKFAGKDDFDTPYDDADYKTICNLEEFQETHQQAVKFIMTYDYANEVVGELRKAINLSWFDDMAGLAIPLKTSNIFYNYYLYVKEEKRRKEKSSRAYDFLDFVKELGIEFSPDPAKFRNNGLIYLQTFANVFGIDYEEKINVRLDGFDEVSRSYALALADMRHKSKSASAIASDVRQSLFYSEKSQNTEDEFYVTSWDTSLYELRNIVKERRSYPSYTYAIHRPDALLNRLALKSFKINDECFTNEIFAYAERSFSLTDKIKSMFDNVLNPLFGSYGQRNPQLVKNIVKIQKEAIDRAGEGNESSRIQTPLPIEVILEHITEKIREKHCSTDEFRLFLNDKSNTTFLTEVIKKALISSENTRENYDYQTAVYNKLVEYLAQKDAEDQKVLQEEMC